MTPAQTQLAPEIAQLMKRVADAVQSVANLPWTPKVNTTAKPDGSTSLEIDLPGVDKKDLSLSIQGGNLVLTGKPSRAVLGHTGEIVERVPLPPGVDPSQVAWNVMNGIVDIDIPAPVNRSVPAGGGQ